MFLSVLSPLCYQTNKINVIRVHVVKTQLYFLVVYWVTTTTGTTTCFRHKCWPSSGCA